MADLGLSRSNAFSNTNSMRRPSLSKAPPAPPSAPPKLPNQLNGSVEHQLRNRVRQYENLYKQTKSQLEVLKLQFKSQEKELQTFKQQKYMIESNHSNIVKWQTQIADLEMEKQRLIDKNGVFLQQKNSYLLQLADAQQANDDLKSELDAKTEQIEHLENERTSTSATYTQQLSKKDDKYKALKAEYNSLNGEYTTLKQRNVSMEQERNAITAELKELKQEKVLMDDQSVKMKEELERIKSEHQQLQTQIG